MPLRVGRIYSRLRAKVTGRLSGPCRFLIHRAIRPRSLVRIRPGFIRLEQAPL
jgi:hypothetical protein